MTFIVTANGEELDLRDPRPGRITLLSTAWSLSQLNRFNGHCLRPYSVAEHSLLVCEIAEREFGLTPQGLFAALMHDAHESVASDLHSPGKVEIGQAWREWEGRWVALFARCFSFASAATAYRTWIRLADLMALATERRDLLPPTPSRWDSLRINGVEIEPVGWVRLNSPERSRFGWKDWRDAFLDRFHELDYARTPAIEHITPRASAHPGDHQ